MSGKKIILQNIQGLQEISKLMVDPMKAIKKIGRPAFDNQMDKLPELLRQMILELRTGEFDFFKMFKKDFERLCHDFRSNAAYSLIPGMKAFMETMNFYDALQNIEQHIQTVTTKLNGALESLKSDMLPSPAACASIKGSLRALKTCVDSIHLHQLFKDDLEKLHTMLDHFKTYLGKQKLGEKLGSDGVNRLSTELLLKGEKGDITAQAYLESRLTIISEMHDAKKGASATLFAPDTERVDPKDKSASASGGPGVAA